MPKPKKMRRMLLPTWAANFGVCSSSESASATSLGAGMNTLMMAHFAAPDADKRNWSVGAQESRIEDGLTYVSGILGDNDYLAGDQFTIADIAVALECTPGTVKQHLSRARHALARRLGLDPEEVS